MAEMNEFVLKCGALPTLTWLDGSSDGEKSIRELVEVGKSTGVVAFNVIPDRNYTPGSPDEKLKNLQEVIQLTEELDLPLIGGTEMNSPGQKLVDSFETEELSAVHPVFLRGARILHAHSTLQKFAEMGYLSSWAEAHFSSAKGRTISTINWRNLFSKSGCSIAGSFVAEFEPRRSSGLGQRSDVGFLIR